MPQNGRADERMAEAMRNIFAAPTLNIIRRHAIYYTSTTSQPIERQMATAVSFAYMRTA